jgi:hypothetical protein
MAAVSGDIDLMPVGDLVIWVANRALSGTFTVRKRGMEVRFVIRDGKLWQAASQDPREYLGQHLINFGYITEEQLQKAFDTQQETHVPLGRVLVMVDAVNQDQLERVLVFKTRESLLEAMSWNDGSFRLTDEVPDTRELDTAQPVDLHEAHSEAVARAAMWHEIRSVFPSDATRVEVTVDPGRLSGFDRKLVHLMAAGRSVGEASLELRSMDFQTYARLYDLYNRGAVRPRLAGPHPPPPPGLPPPPPMQPRSPTPAPGALPRRPTPRAGGSPSATLGASTYVLLRPEQPAEAPGVHVPAEAQDPSAAMQVALAGRNWSDALLLAQRILEVDPQSSEAIAAWRVAEAQLRKTAPADEGVDLTLIPRLAMPREQIALAHLTSKERYVLSRVDGRRSLQQIAAVSPIQKAELVRIVNAFVSRGVLKFEP